MKITEKWPRAYALVDMVAFFASVEQLDFPELRGKAVAVVNGEAGSTIVTASYEARKFGIKTGTRVYEAKAMCPHLICRTSRHRRYGEISDLIMAAIAEHVTCDMEVYSIDECYLDLKPVLKLYGSVENIARRIRQIVFLASGGLKCSIGISEGKLTAKYAASIGKGGTTILSPERIKEVIGRAPIGNVCGIGKQTEKYLNQRGIYYCRDLAKHPMNVLSDRFGNVGKRLYLTTQGHDPEPLSIDHALPKSMGHSKILPPFCMDYELIRAKLFDQCDRVGLRLRSQGLKAGCIFVGVRLQTGWLSVKEHPSDPEDRTAKFLSLAKQVMAKWDNKTPTFQVQIMLTNLSEKAVQQLGLFDEISNAPDSTDAIEDEINLRFNRRVIYRGGRVNLAREEPNS